ncbi:MAG: hypothetical protein U9R20_06405, partial [Thermodesulfobacteriota bacterium]|nr:hypothetical protein [Thermodesulfobacteriota bacterium]
MSEKERTDQAGSVSGDSRLMLNERDIKQIGEEVSRYLKAESHLSEKMIDEVNRFDQDLKLHHKIIYGTLVFLGVVLIWYGLWDIVGMIPILKNPYVAAMAGIILLALTGTFYKKLS